MSSQKIVCDVCEWRGLNAELLHALNPFDEEETIEGCPKCKSPECFTLACEYEDCWREASCGTPTPYGYAQTCGKHQPR